jgi:GNAT superfamily N-acetyltransferase
MTDGRPISPELVIRPLRDADSPALIDLIGTIWRSYPGIVFDVDAELPELKAPAAAFAQAGGQGWVAERADRVLGSVGVAPTGSSPGLWELLKLYVDARERRQGIARRLLRLAENWAKARGAVSIELWTDTRFTQAHNFYARHGYGQDGLRRLADLSRTVEYRFYKRL